MIVLKVGHEINIMEVKDLRIGNYILNNEYNIIQVYQYDRRSDKRSQLNDITFDNRCISDYYEPAPLTDELLVRFGFEKTKSKLSVFKIDDWIEVIKQPQGYDFYCRGTYLTLCLYAHQIQNLYSALSSKELILKS